MRVDEEKVRDERREWMYKEAAELIAGQGFRATSVRDICRTVGIKESSFYLYFEKKDAVLDEIFAEFERLFLDEPVPVEKLPPAVSRYAPAQILCRALELCFLRLDDSHIRNLWQILLSEQFRDPRAARLLLRMNGRLAETAGALFTELRRNGLIGAGTDLPAAAGCFASSVRMLFYDYLSPGEKPFPRYELKKLTDFFLKLLMKPEKSVKGE